MLESSKVNMNSNKRIGRITGILFLLVFISGIIIFQILQGPNLFSEDYLTLASQNGNKVTGSVVLGIFSGILSIVIAILLLPIFKKYNTRLAYLYVVLCTVNFIAIMIDNVSVLSMLEVSREFIEKGNSDVLSAMGNYVYEKHNWTHYLYLLVSCFPVFILYYTLFLTKLVPRIISIFGIIAVLLMFVEEFSYFFGQSISVNLLLPMALIQLILPLWLIYKGLPYKVDNVK